MNLTFLALLWAATAGAISLVSVRLFLGRLISRSCAFVFVPMAVLSVLLTFYPSLVDGTSFIVNSLYLLFLPVISALIMVLICLWGFRKTGIEEESFWKSVNILSLMVIVIFKELNFAVTSWNQFIYRGFMNLSAGSLVADGSSVAYGNSVAYGSSVVDGSAIVQSIVLTESFGWIFLLLALPCVLGAFYFSPRTKGEMFSWLFVVPAASIISMSLFVTGGLFSVALIITVPWLVARDGIGLRKLLIRAMLAGCLFGVFAFVFNLATGLPSALGGAFAVFSILAFSRRKVPQ